MHWTLLILALYTLKSAPCAFAGYTEEALGRSVVVNSGLELARALAQPDITDIIINQSITLKDSDFSGVGPLPLLLERNVSIRGSPFRAATEDPVTFDGGSVEKKIRLATNVVLALSQLLLTNYYDPYMAQNGTPGLDLLAESEKSGSSDAATALLLRAVVLLHSFCLPRDTYWARPSLWPGVQNTSVDLAQPGCLNDTSAPLLQRCWAARRVWYDIAVFGTEAGAGGATTYTHYNVRFLNATLLCSNVMPTDCIYSYGFTGCYFRMSQSPVGPPPPLPPLPPPPPERGMALLGLPAAGGAQVSVAGIVLGVVLGAGTVLAIVVLVVVASRRGWVPRRSVAAFTLWVQGSMQRGDAVQPSEAPGVMEGSPNLPAAIEKDAARETCPAGPCCPLDAQQQPEACIDGAAIAVGLGPAVAQPALFWDAQSTMTSGVQELQLPPPPPQQQQQQHESEAEEGLNRGQEPDRQQDQSERVESRATDSDSSSRHQRLDPAVPVTALTPQRADMQLLQGSPTNGDNEVKLLPNTTLGKGAFGHVSVGTYKGQRVAVKLVAEVHQFGGSPPEPLIRSFAQEVEVLGRCCHPNVVRLLAACLTPPRLCLVMELMEASLERLLYEGPPDNILVQWLPLPTVLHIALQICQGLEYLHPTIVHRDLKPANVLLNDPWSNRPVVKITDFGLARLRTSTVPTETPDAGTPPYLAPEGFEICNNVITCKADMYSLGILIWEMVTGEKPWRACNVMQVAYNVAVKQLRPPLCHLPEARCPHKLKCLMTQCWDADPRRRPAAAEAAKRLLQIAQEVERQSLEQERQSTGVSSITYL